MDATSDPVATTTSNASTATSALAHPAASPILEYLKHDLPGYRFEHRLDVLFVTELLVDFPDTDVLEELKALRWYHDNEPLSGVKSQRVAIRRWIARAARSRYR